VLIAPSRFRRAIAFSCPSRRPRSSRHRAHRAIAFPSRHRVPSFFVSSWCAPGPKSKTRPTYSSRHRAHRAIAFLRVIAFLRTLRVFVSSRPW
jgi:hypothetical protein